MLHFRSRMEDRICEEGRLDSEKNYENRTCFDEALVIVEAVLTQQYLPPFFSSTVFKYVRVCSNLHCMQFSNLTDFH